MREREARYNSAACRKVRVEGVFAARGPRPTPATSRWPPHGSLFQLGPMWAILKGQTAERYRVLRTRRHDARPDGRTRQGSNAQWRIEELNHVLMKGPA